MELHQQFGGICGIAIGYTLNADPQHGRVLPPKTSLGAIVPEGAGSSSVQVLPTSEVRERNCPIGR